MDWLSSHSGMNTPAYLRDPSKRRSRRMKLDMRLLIAPADPAADPHPFNATATNLNQHGAMISSERELNVLSHLMLINRQKETAVAKVVAKLGEKRSLKHYGVEFIDSQTDARFWGISFLSESSPERTGKP